MSSHAVAEDLQSLLVEVIDLSLTSRQAQWILVRPLFDPLSAELEGLAADAWTWADALGARLAGMGVPPDGRAATVAEQARFADWAAGFVDDAEAVAPVVVRLNRMIEECPRRIESLRDSDPISEDLIIRVVAGLVTHRWLLVSQVSGESSPSDEAEVGRERAGAGKKKADVDERAHL
ncbi:MAG: ferritin-like domain-containing protein [Ilumatobacteraceae bacterium]